MARVRSRRSRQPKTCRQGCKHYALLEDPAKPGHFQTFEIWADKAAIDAHLNSPDMEAMGPKLKDILAANPVITPLVLISDS
jgi:quinol monooxygenase YgiN